MSPTMLPEAWDAVFRQDRAQTKTEVRSYSA